MRIYPPGQCTRYGNLRLLSRTEPLVIITSWDGEIEWYIDGPMAPVPGVQEGALLVDGIAGMFPDFMNIGHKGARQHGITYQRTVYEPGEIEMKVEFTVPPNPLQPHVAAQAIRRVIRDWMATWDPEHPPTMKVVTPDMGVWWCQPRLHRSPPDRQFRAQMHRLRQTYTWSIMNEFAFWRGVDSISEFKFRYTSAVDDFNRSNNWGLGPRWKQTYLGSGLGRFGTESPDVINGVRWTPAHVISRFAWFDAQSLELEDGDPVADWPDKGGNGNHLSQADSSKQPTFSAFAINGRPAVVGDGVNDYLTCDDTGLSHQHPYTVYAVVGSDKENVSAAYEVAIGGSDGSGNFRSLIQRTSNEAYSINSGGGSGQDVTSDAGAWTTGPKLIKAVFNGSSSYIEVDGVQVASGSAAQTTMNQLSLFARHNGTAPFDGYIGEVIWARGVLTDFTDAFMYPYLRRRWGLDYKRSIAGRAAWFENGNDMREVRNRFLGVNAVQTVSFVGATGGDTLLLFDDEPTDLIPFDTSAFELQSALEAVSTIGEGNVLVTGGDGNFEVEFQNDLGCAPQDLIEWTFQNAIQHLTIVGSPGSGAFRLSYENQETEDIPHNPTSSDIQEALEALTNIGLGDVEVTGSGTEFDIEFKGALANTNIELLEATDTFNTGSVEIETATRGVGFSGTNAHVTVADMIVGTDGLTGTNNQVIHIEMGELLSINLVANGYFDIWARLDDDDDNPTGLRVRIGGGVGIFGDSITLSRFNNGVETVMHSQALIIPPLNWESWTFIVGFEENARRYKLLRNSYPAFDFIEEGTGSAIGPDNRGSGFGARAAAGLVSQGVTASINQFEVGDNEVITQEGHVALTNFGTQDAYPRYLCYGPGTFLIGDGPDADTFIEFGPLLENQIALLPALPRLRGVTDLSPEPVPEQQLNPFQEFVDRLMGLAVNNNIPPMIELFESLFGILPPQGELYHLLKGRFTKPIPAKPTGGVPTTVRIPVQIVNGTADSKIVAAVTPLRTWPE